MMFQPSGGGGGVNAWATGTPYVVGDIVSYGKNLYICIVAHTAAATIEADIGAGKWEIEVKPIKLQNLCLWGNTFEDNDTGGWTACGCATVTNGFPASVGTGGAAFSSSNGGRAKGANTTSPAIVSSGQINGQYSMNFATSGAGTIGDMYISSAYPVPIKYQSKVLSFEIAFKVVSGTPVMGGTSSDTYAVAIYDVANNAWIQPAGCFSFTQSSGVGIASGSFQASSSMTSFQIAIYNPVAPTGASSLYFEDIYVGPQPVTWGVPITDWKIPIGTYTLSSSGTPPTVGNSTVTVYERRIGDVLGVRYKILIGSTFSAGTGDYRLVLPYTIDTSKIVNETAVGTGSILDSGTTRYSLTAKYESGFITLIDRNLNQVGATGSPITWATGDSISFDFTVPIVGWSSNTVMSSDAATNVVAAFGSKALSGTIPTGETVIDFGSTIDTNGAITTGASWKFTAPVAGKYKVTAHTEATSSGACTLYLKLYKNTTLVNASGHGVGATGYQMVPSITGIVDMSAGDYIQVKAIGSNANGSYVNDANLNWINIERISGPAQIAASETVSCRAYRSGSGVSVTAASNTELVFNSTSDDSHNGFNTTTGRYTAPISGRYLITTIVQITMGATAATDVETFVKINGGATYYAYDYTNSLANSKIYKWKASDVVRLLAGDYVSLFVNPTGQTVTVNHTGASNSVTEMTITRIGNY